MKSVFIFDKNAHCGKNIKLIIGICQKVGYNLINKNADCGKKLNGENSMEISGNIYLRQKGEL